MENSGSNSDCVSNCISEYNVIIPGLILGSIDGLYSKLLNQIEKIDMIISVTPLEETPIPSKYKDCNLRIPISFTMEIDDIVQIVNNVVVKLNENMKKKKTIYIHCYEGVSRSAICVMYYLVKYHGYTKPDAFNYVKIKRPNISPNDLMLKVYERL